ncbi:Protein MtfA [BD1-7 clade bacterium]|uniref:Protein MtfA n=1 Tax=BD1-7 clade bacterium TaxID=2029982 RepID=A0A5S9NTT6_9GAMM|nr:Protein MtfA [BD1-7 clade bacterium]CAA0109333.1 Protein MtfA [BD1-7 clade bacterium]
MDMPPVSGWIFVIVIGAILATVIYSVLVYPLLRKRKALALPLSDEWRSIIESSVPYYPRFTSEEQQHLERLIKYFLVEKVFFGCAGLVITDEIRVTIAAQASLLVLHKGSDAYPKLHYILVYPSGFSVERDQVGAGGVVENRRMHMLGESWHNGKIILSWEDVRKDSHESGTGHNVVLHEFSHQLDSETGAANGTPLLPNKDYQRWANILDTELSALRYAASLQIDSVMDKYGATSEAEFFAVATETFFGKPYQLAQRHSELFQILVKYYQFDPRQWQDEPLYEPIDDNAADRS